MRRLLLLVAVIGTALLTAGLAGAGNGSSTSFTAAFTIHGDWSCTGTHIANKKHVFDNETCLISGTTSDTTPEGVHWAWVAGTFKNDTCSGAAANVGHFPPFNGVLGNEGTDCIRWSSDYDGAIADSWTITVTDNGDGTFTAQIHAAYPLS